MEKIKIALCTLDCEHVRCNNTLHVYYKGLKNNNKRLHLCELKNDENCTYQKWIDIDMEKHNER